MVNRPHPWGLLVTFIELIKNPSYKFWQHEFVHCAPEVEKLFESVAKSCMTSKTISLSVALLNINLINCSQSSSGPNGPSIVALENSPDILSLD